MTTPSSSPEKESGDGFGARLLQGITGAIWETERATPKAAPENTDSSSATTHNTAITPASQAPVDESMVQNLIDLVQSKSSAYTAFNEAIIPLIEIIPDETTRYRAAFAVIKKNRTLEQVVQAISLQHLPALDDEINRFEQQAQSQEKNAIQPKISEVESLEHGMERARQQGAALRLELENKMKALESQIAKDTQKMDTLKVEIQQEHQAIADVQRQFMMAAEKVRSSFEQAQEKISRYLT